MANTELPAAGAPHRVTRSGRTSGRPAATAAGADGSSWVSSVSTCTAAALDLQR